MKLQSTMMAVMMAVMGTGRAAQAAPSDFILVKDGAPAATIVVPQSPGPAWFGAGELQYHVRRITGATLPVVKEGEPVTGSRILIGMTAASRELGAAYRTFQPQEYAIHFAGDSLALLGADPALDPAQQNSPLKLDTIPEWYSPVGSLHAVYDFLERFCGVRWYAPTEDGMVLPQTRTLQVSRKDLRRRPALELRQNPGSGQPGTWGMVGRELQGDEEKLLMTRLKMGGRHLLIGHAFEGYPARFWEKDPAHPEVFEEKHPEYFSRKANGTIDPSQMCFSSPALVAQVVKDARDYFDGKGLKYRADAGEDYFCVGPRDAASDACQCELCQPKVSRANWPYFSSGRSSELIWGFVNKVAKEVKKTHPDKHIACFNYFDYAFYPTTVTVDPSVYVGPCLHSANWFARAMEKNDLAFYNQWVDKMPRGNMICVWMYQCFPWEAGQTAGFKVFPSWHAHTIDRQMKMFARDGVRGVFVCGGVTPYIDGYLTIKLMDDPTIDVNQALDEFFKGYYGSAARPMKQLYLAIEQTYSNSANYPPDVKYGRTAPHQSEEMAWQYLGTATRMAVFEGYLKDAEAKADSDLARRRVAVFRKDIWQHMLEGRTRWERKTRYAAEVQALKAAAPPHFGAIPCTADPAAGGDPAKVDWTRGIQLKINRDTQGYPVQKETLVNLLHDGTYLYMRIKEPTDVGSLVNAGFFGDRWEMFFAKQRAEPYRQLGLMPDGSVSDHAIGQEASWNSGARRVDNKEGGFWTIQLSIPIANMALNGLKPGDPLYLNFIRGASGGKDILAYSPIFQTAFHCLPRMAEGALGDLTQPSPL